MTMLGAWSPRRLRRSRFHVSSLYAGELENQWPSASHAVTGMQRVWVYGIVRGEIMKHVLLAILMLSGAFARAAATESEIFCGGKDDTQIKGCSVIFRDGKEFHVYSDDLVQIVVKAPTLEKIFGLSVVRVWVEIYDKSPTPIDVDPQNVVAIGSGNDRKAQRQLTNLASFESEPLTHNTVFKGEKVHGFVFFRDPDIDNKRDTSLPQIVGFKVSGQVYGFYFP